MGAACCESDPNLDIQNRGPSGAGGLNRPEGPSGSKIKLEYFGGAYGRPDPIVQLLEHKGVPYERIDLSMAQWGVRKGLGKTGEMGQLPIVHRSGKE